MSPYLTAPHLRYEAPAHSQIRSNRAPGFSVGAAGSYFQHQLIGQLCHPVPLTLAMKHHAALMGSALLGIAVNGVLPRRASNEMGRVDAWSIVTGVHDDREVVGDAAVGEEVRDSVRGLPAMAPLQPAHKSAVSLVTKGSHPRPASIRSTGLVNLLPEILNLSWGKINAHVTSFRDVPRPRQLQLRSGISVLYEQLYYTEVRQ
jgi:hypothetical protein